MRQTLGPIVGAVFGIALVTTCGQMTSSNGGGGGGGGTGGGGGNLMGDLAGRVFDIATADAQGTPAAMSTACDKINMLNGENYYFGEVSVPGLDPTMAPQISAVICGFQTTGTTGPPPFYVQGTGTGYTLPSGYCVAAPAVVLSPGKVIVYCGAQAGNGTSGWNSTNVYVRVN